MAPHDPNMVAALRRERAGYEARGLTDRVAQVDEQLAYYEADDIEVPQGRTADPKQVTTQSPAPPPADPSSASRVDTPTFAEPNAQIPAEASSSEPAAPAEPEVKPGRGRPRKPRDAQGNIIRE